jgi:hypothetical protein
MKTICTLIITILSGTIVIEEVLPRVVDSTIPVFNDAITWQENTVRTAEHWGLSCAKPAREEWEVSKAKAYQRIEEFKQMKEIK